MDEISFIYYILMTAINAISIVLNFVLLVMLLVYRTELLTNAHNKILLAMLFAGFLIGITGTVNWLLVTMKAGKVFYKLIGMIPMFSFFIASIATLCILTFDQLIAVKFPLRYAAIVTTGRIHVAIFFAFAIAIAFASVQIIIYKFEGSQKELQVRGLVVTFVFILGMLTLLTTNYQLYKAIQYQRKRLRPLSDNQTQEKTENEPCREKSNESRVQNIRRPVRKFKTGRMCIVLVVIYMVNWLPLVTYRIKSIIDLDNAIPLYLRISMVLATLYQIAMPCFYLLKRRDFRKKLASLICRSYNHAHVNHL